jgi:O-antigen ligase
MIVGFLAFEHGDLHATMALISWAGMWPGYVTGFEISLLDFLLLAIYLSLPRTNNSLPFLFSIGFYFFAVLLSVFQAGVPEAALFYILQLMRIIFVYAVVAKACADDRVVPSLLKGMAVGLLWQAGLAISQRFGGGLLQTAGGFASQNLLGMMSHFVIFPFFALLLAGERGWFPIMTTLSGTLIAVLTTSRATIVATAVGYFVMFILSALRGWTPRKGTIAIASVIFIVALSPLAISSFETRFSRDVGEQFLEPDDARVEMAEAASIMFSEHPMGIGANHFVRAANIQGYYARAGLNWFNSGATVHNVYWLVAAETGFLGIIGFVFLLLRPLVVGFSCGWRNRRDRRGDLLLGFCVALSIVYLHSFYEWIFITFYCQYVFAVFIGLIAGLAQQLNYWPRTRTYAVQLPTDELVRPAERKSERYRAS